MKKVIIVLCMMILVLPIEASAEAKDPRHMVELTTSGFGVGGSYEKFDTSKGTKGVHYDDFDILKGNISFNYNYAFADRLQIGGFLSNGTEERHYKSADNKKGEIAIKSLIVGVAFTWNFSDDLRNAPYLRFIYSHLNHEEEYSKNVFYYLEDDREADTYELAVGKRFQLSKWGLENFSYSPSFSIFTRNSTKDFEDDGIDDSLGVTVQILKIDLLI